MRALPTGWSEIYRIVRRIPRGCVATYGEVALVAGKPRGARQVGFALAALRGAKHDVPWQRVVGARARGRAAISILDPVGAAVQRALLEREGVRLDDRGRIDLARYGWQRGVARGGGPAKRGRGAAPLRGTARKAKPKRAWAPPAGWGVIRKAGARRRLPGLRRRRTQAQPDEAAPE